MWNVLLLATLFGLNPQILELGDPVPELAARSEVLILTGPARSRPSYTAVIGRDIFTLATDTDEKIVYIWTGSESFQTPENVSVGSSLKESQKSSKAEMMHEPGWGCYLPLPSGWNAYFSLECPEPLDDSFLNSAKVTGLFKRNGSG